jgi:hypothetical protein
VDVVTILNSPLMVIIPGVAGVALFAFSEPVKAPKLGGLLAKLKGYVPYLKSDPSASFRQSIEGIREKASHRGCFKSCEERAAAFAKLDAIDGLLDELFPAEAA